MALELIKGASLLLALSFLYSFLYRLGQKNKMIFDIAAGLLFGGICVVGMVTPLVISPGVIFDARSVVLSISGLFGGPVVGSIALGIAAGYRYYIGGGGVGVGITVIASCVLMGLVYRYLHSKHKVKVDFFRLLAFGVLVHLVEISIFTQLPDDVVDKVMDNVALPLLLVFSPAIVRRDNQSERAASIKMRMPSVGTVGRA
ncbi:MAG: hypothetical protein HQK66_13520 [Desulfamplus sp.]|nr:hypothetical protein [Desulfamplus sp.]